MMLKQPDQKIKKKAFQCQRRRVLLQKHIFFFSVFFFFSELIPIEKGGKMI